MGEGCYITCFHRVTSAFHRIGLQLANSVNDAWSEWLRLGNDAIDKNIRILKNNSGPAWVDSESR